MVKEILFDGRNVIDEDGDVLPRHDFSRDEYPEPPAEILSCQAKLHALDLYDETLQLKSIVGRGSGDKEVRKLGGIGACRKKILDLSLETRRAYLGSEGIGAYDKPLDGAPDFDEKMNEFDQGVALWVRFRTQVLEDQSACFSLRHELEEKIEQYEDLFHS